MHPQRIIETLKTELRRQGITYASLAKELRLSEAAIKKMFAHGDFSLSRLADICKVLGLDEKDLFRRLAQNDEDVIPMLTDAQDAGLAEDDVMLLVFYFLLLGKDRDEARSELGLSEKQLFSTLRAMDKLELIELHRNGVIRFKIPRAPRWKEGGPLATKYGLALQEEFYASDFRGRLEKHDFHTGSLSEESFQVLRRRLVELFKEFNNMSDLDRNLNPDRLTTFWFYAGVRPWDPIAVIKRVQGER